MSTLGYARYELLRTVRNRQSIIFPLVVPLIMYFLLAGPNRDNHNFGGDATHHTGLFAPQYYMVGLLSFGGMAAVFSVGGRIAAERTIGWNRQMRLTPLSVRTYMRVKVLLGYATALVTMLLLYSAGIALGVRMPMSHWLQMTALILVALVPFAAMGIAFGHLLNDDAVGAAIGLGISLFAFLGGTWFPITGHGLFVDFVQVLPSYWLVQAGHIGIGASDPWTTKAWIVVIAWSVVTIAFAGWAFRRDTSRR